MRTRSLTRRASSRLRSNPATAAARSPSAHARLAAASSASARSRGRPSAAAPAPLRPNALHAGRERRVAELAGDDRQRLLEVPVGRLEVAADEAGAPDHDERAGDADAVVGRPRRPERLLEQRLRGVLVARRQRLGREDRQRPHEHVRRAVGPGDAGRLGEVVFGGLPVALHRAHGPREVVGARLVVG
jgi:hypothetical protein